MVYASALSFFVLFFKDLHSIRLELSIIITIIIVLMVKVKEKGSI